MSTMLAACKEKYPWEEAVLDVNDPRLMVDGSYQRDEVKAVVNRIVAEGFDLVRAGYIYVNERPNGMIAIIDGRQRWQAARTLGESEILCIYLIGMTVEEEADLYCDLNENRQQPSALDRFKGAWRAGKPWALAIRAITREYGADIAKCDGATGNLLIAISAIRYIYDQGGDIELRGTYDVVQDALDVISRDTTHSNFLRGVHMVISRHPDVDRKRLAQKVRKQGMVALRTRAIAVDRGNPSHRGFYLVLLDEYNNRLPLKKRIDPKFRCNE